MSDLISRQAAIDATWFEPSYTDPLNVLTEVRDRLKALPSAQPNRGKWETGIDERFVKCSECGLMTTRNELRGLAAFGENEPNFCPMIEVDTDDIVSRKYLLAEYDRQHVGPPGGARKIIEKAPSAIEGEKADAQSIYLEKTESRLDDSIKDPTKDPEFTKSCLQAYKNIIATGGCNECAIRAMCNKRPDWGKLVRYNCIYFRRDNNV